MRLLGGIANGPEANPQTRQNLALAYALAGDTEAARRVAAVDLPEAEVAANLKSLSSRSGR